MIDNQNILTAIELLQSEISNTEQQYQQEIILFTKDSDYLSIKLFLSKIKKLQSINKKILNLKNEISKLTLPPKPKKNRKSLSNKTSKTAFYFPLLQLIDTKGGILENHKISNLLFKSMKDKLVSADLETNPKTNDPLWFDTLQAARTALLAKGLLKNNSRRGLWEITAKGIRYYKIKEKTTRP